MDTLIASCSEQKNVGIKEVLCLCVVNPFSVLVACLGTTDLFLLAVDEETILVDKIYPVGLIKPAKKLRHVELLGVTFLLSDTTLYSAKLRANSMNFLQAVDSSTLCHVKDFDVVILKEGVFVAVLQMTEIFVLVYSSDGIFPLSRFNVGNCSSCIWITPDCLSCTGENTLNIYGFDGTHICSIGSQKTPALCAVPLLEYFLLNTEISGATKQSGFVALFEKSNVYFSYYLAVYSQMVSVFTMVLRFSILSPSLPKCIFSSGPWICVGGSFGLEFYDLRTGLYVQSLLESVSPTIFSLANGCLDAALLPNDSLYSRPRYSIAVAENCIYSLCLRSILDIVDDFKGDTALCNRLMESFVEFGQSVHARRIMRKGDRRDVVLNSSILFSDYSAILAKFYLPQKNLSLGDGDIVESNKSDSTCQICGFKSFFALKFSACALCCLIVCQKCSFLRNLRLYGYTNTDRHCTVCANCDGRCDLNLYRLFTARRYTLIFHYMEDYPERCYKLSFSEVLSPVLHQCFAERKFELCAELLEKYVQKHDVLWDEWVLRFGLQKQIRCLACVHNPSHASETVNTGILLQLVKNDVQDLYMLLQQWPKMSYNVDTVLLGIISRLLWKRERARALQESCQIGTLNFLEWQNAVSGLYFDKDVDFLLRAFLHLCLQNSRYMDAAKGYMEHYVMMLPMAKDLRKRSFEVFEESTLGEECKNDFPPSDLIDLWDLLTSNNILEEFIHLKDSSGNTSFLTLLFIYYREEFGRYLIESVSADERYDILQATVSELKEKQPAQLFQVLDALTRLSPLSTSHYHSLLAEFYLEYAPEKLFSFIQHPLVSGLNWKKLAKAVENQKMYRELVYIVGKTGNDLEAIRMAIRYLKSVPLALEYVKDHPDDTRLCYLVMENVIQSPVLIGDFLDQAEDFVDMRFFLQLIPEPNRLQVPRGGPRLKKLLQSRWCVERIAESSVDSISVDNYALLVQLRRKACRGARSVHGTLCGACGEVALGDYVVDGSGFVFHPGCFHI